MFYLITNYFYPLKNEILLSKHFNFILDNPRTTDEIESISKLIQDTHEKSEVLKFPPIAENQYISLKYFLKEISNYYSENDEYLKNVFSNFKLNSTKSIYKAMAEIVIIVRYNDNDENKRINKEVKLLRSEGKAALALLDEENLIFKNADQLKYYGHVLSLLTQDNEYRGSFINSFDSFHTKNIRFSQNLFYLASIGMSTKRSIKKNRDEWLGFTLIADKLLHNSKLIEAFVDDNSEDRICKLLYVGEVLSLINEDVKDNKMKILLYTSIIEMLVARNPDSNRFNIEDSINKQFQLKTTIISHLANSQKRNLEEVKKEMQDIYSLRSMIAHGNYSDIKKFVSKKKDKYVLDKYVSKLSRYTKEVVSYYISNPDFVDFIKNS